MFPATQAALAYEICDQASERKNDEQNERIGLPRQVHDDRRQKQQSEHGDAELLEDVQRLFGFERMDEGGCD
jgi:hypothetical protein